MNFNRCVNTLWKMLYCSAFSCFQATKTRRCFFFSVSPRVKIKDKHLLLKFRQLNVTSLLFEQHQSSGLTFLSSQDVQDAACQWLHLVNRPVCLHRTGASIDVIEKTPAGVRVYQDPEHRGRPESMSQLSSSNSFIYALRSKLIPDQCYFCAVKTDQYKLITFLIHLRNTQLHTKVTVKQHNQKTSAVCYTKQLFLHFTETI